MKKMCIPILLEYQSLIVIHDFILTLFIFDMKQKFRLYHSFFIFIDKK